MPVGICVVGSATTAGVPIQLCPGPWQAMQPLVKSVWFIGGTALAITKVLKSVAEWQLVQAVVPTGT